MGWSWRPLNRPKPGKELQFTHTYNVLTGREKERVNIIRKIFNRPYSEKEYLAILFSISIEPYETLQAPRVGYDKAATEWAKEQFEKRSDRSLNLEDFLLKMHGYYVLELAPSSDGLPPYPAPGEEIHIFHAELLNDCREIMGEALFEKAKGKMLSVDTEAFGQELLSVAEHYAFEAGVSHVKELPQIPPEQEDAAARKAHVLFAASRWLIFWGERAHGFEASY
jgi:hypothetical protein